MTFLGLSVEGSRGDRGKVIIYFGIPAGRELVAGGDLLACLAEGAEVCLRNNLDDGGEGYLFFRNSPSGLVTMIGGHGWQSEWKPTDECAVLSAVAELADFNRGGHWSTQGSSARRKTQAEPGTMPECNGV
jgi:hypothetical protein